MGYGRAVSASQRIRCHVLICHIQMPYPHPPPVAWPCARQALYEGNMGVFVEFVCEGQGFSLGAPTTCLFGAFFVFVSVLLI